MIELLSLLPHWLKVLVSAAVPVFELRFSIPFGIGVLKMSYLSTYLLSVLGSIIPAPFILWFIPSILKWMRSTKIFGKPANWLYDRGIKKSKSIEKHSFWGMFILVAIPLPGTGVWTGCLAASLIQMEFKKAFFAALLGTMAAGIAMMILTYLGLAVV